MDGVLGAFAVGILAQSSLIIAGVLVCWVRFSRRFIGLAAGFGAGALTAAIAFDLVPEADALSNVELMLGMAAGVVIFLVGDRLVERRFGDKGEGKAMGIVVGSVVDGVPESVILGIQIAAGNPVGAAFVAAVWVSNIPQAIAPSADLARAGWRVGRLAWLWSLVVLACGAAAGLGYLVTSWTGTATGAWMAAIAAGGLLAMLTDSLIPFAYERAKDLAGAATVLGFCLTLGGS
ncbi:ZIP family metal transporter [Demequina sp. NBRC 110056]|uniref:ZIP family metal transporter n=1 Tax=Demequina sp. NBRC 110056 TaxID=1570345 RepID=UPI0009FFE0C5|nr:hypothetical protein [Demequina sp. NBRC 110056]